MILPLFILIADIAAWWLTNKLAETISDTAITAICAGIGIILVVWLVIEVYQLSENAVPRGRSDTDYFE